MDFIFKKDGTNEIKTVKAGPSWILLFFTSFLGIPLFIRKLNTWGFVVLGIYILNIIFALIFFYDEGRLQAINMLFLFVFIGINIFFCINGNKMTALNYIDLGFKIHEQDENKINYIKVLWNLPENAFAK